MRKLLPLLVLAACGSDHANPSPPTVPGTSVTTTLSSTRQAELADVQAKLDAVAGLDAAGFATKYAMPFAPAGNLGYDPLTAQRLDLIKKSPIAPNDGELATLAANGFAVTDRLKYPSFIYGYESIYAADLPVYISADAILYAVHKSFDSILQATERGYLIPSITQLLAGMRDSLAAGGAGDLPAAARADADVYLAVAQGLLTGQQVHTIAGGDDALAGDLFAKATAAKGDAIVTIFGSARDVDFSQFTPRGHYADQPGMQQYFRAQMWLGRTEFRILETQPDHSQVFNRRQLEGAYVLRALMDSTALASWKLVDDTIAGFIGEPDNMTVPQLDSLLSDLKLARAADLATLSDAAIAQAVVNGAYGAQRISSQIMVNGLGSGTMPLSSTFLLLGQRYVVDSNVFSNVVYDRVNIPGLPRRMMPNPLDVAFAALGSDHAGGLLKDELVKYAYAPALASMRVLVDAHPTDYWDGSLYTEWLSLQRSLSPKASEVTNPSAVGLPKLAGTEAWNRRILSTQLASWAELRHDTILYAKQSYTGGDSCEYPDAYIDPYPELFARLGAFAAKGAALTASMPLVSNFSGTTLPQYFDQVRTVAATLEAMAKNQRAGAAHTADQLAFINSLTFQAGCGTPSFDGWYAKLFWNADEAVAYDPIVADVHTQPDDENGNPVGHVLHVGTSAPRTMFVTVESCSGPHAYVGLVSSYHERITDNFERLTDETWSQSLQTPDATLGSPADPPWLADLVAH